MTMPKLPPVSSADVLAIRQRVNASAPLDSLINELARQQGAIDDLVLKLRMLRAQQGLAEVLLPMVDSTAAGLKVARLDAGMPLAVEKGFYAMEYDGSGDPFRWTGPAPVFSFDLHLDRRQPLKLNVHIATGFGEASDEVRAFSDGIELPLLRQPVVGGITCSLVLMPRTSYGITRLSMLARKMFKPDAASLDQRTLGVVFRALEVQPADDAEVQTYLGALDDLRHAQMSEPIAPALADAGLLAPAALLADVATGDEA